MNNNFENILEGKNLFVEKIVDKKYLKEKESLFNKAFNFHKEGNLEKAIFFYKESINKGILDDRVFVNLGVIFQSYSRFDIAIKLYSKVIDLNPNSAVAFANLGLILLFPEANPIRPSRCPKRKPRKKIGSKNSGSSNPLMI